MKYYVYALIDPRDLQPFYIGKGTASRRFNHMKKIPNATVGPKGERIQEIQDAGLIVQSAVMSWYATEEEAYAGEKEAIAKIGLDKLTNVAVGGNGDRKPKRSTKSEEQGLTSKQERFSQLVASGTSASDAYREAYDVKKASAKTINEAASRVLANSKVSARVEELRKPVIEGVQVTLESLLNRLVKAYEVAEETDQASGMVAATRELGKLADLYPAEKRENFNHDMSDIAERIQKARDNVVPIKRKSA